MKFSFRKYFSLFLLGTFLFAYSEKGIHDIVHADDPHCHVLYENHFHTIEHHCAICDFEFPWYDKSAKPLQISYLRCFCELQFISPQSNVSVKEVSTRSSRAPPAIV
jgi:hypothetical protein